MIVLTHNLGTRDVVISLIDENGHYFPPSVFVIIEDENTISLDPPDDACRVIVQSRDKVFDYRLPDFVPKSEKVNLKPSLKVERELDLNEKVNIPTDVLVGKMNNEWPLRIFLNEAKAMSWAGIQPTLNKRRLFRCKLEVIEEVVLVNPKPYLISLQEDEYDR